MDPYVVLGVPEKASQAEIKKAYRQKCRLWHPDVNSTDPKAEDHFKRVSQAYETLSDAGKRQQYDMRKARGSLGFDFASFTGRGTRRRQHVRTRLVATITLRQAYEGTSVNVSGPSASGKGGISVAIPPRVRQGASIRLPQAHPGGDEVHLVVSYPMREGGVEVDRMGNVRCSIAVPWSRALYGEEASASIFEGGARFLLKLDRSMANGVWLRFKGQGMKPNGDLLVKVLFTLPGNLKEEDAKGVAAV